MSAAPDAEFTRSSFGGGWIVPKTQDAEAELSYLIGERPYPLVALGNASGWIVEPYEAADIVTHMRDAGYEVTL